TRRDKRLAVALRTPQRRPVSEAGLATPSCCGELSSGRIERSTSRNGGRSIRPAERCRDRKRPSTESGGVARRWCSPANSRTSELALSRFSHTFHTTFSPGVLFHAGSVAGNLGAGHPFTSPFATGGSTCHGLQTSVLVS